MPPAVLLLDSRDSFTFNLAHAFAELGATVNVVEVDGESAASLLAAARTHALVVVGPGPRGPHELSHLVEVVRAIDGVRPMLGVCLGLQALVAARGGMVGHARKPVHGQRSLIRCSADARLFDGLPPSLWVMRYHSLVATTVPSSLRVTAMDDDNQVMAVEDVQQRVHAVQFHPESVGTAGGMHILANALAAATSTLASEYLPPLCRRGAVPPADDLGPRVRLAAGSIAPVAMLATAHKRR
jgi:anthranilate synthase component II